MHLTPTPPTVSSLLSHPSGDSIPRERGKGENEKQVFGGSEVRLVGAALYRAEKKSWYVVARNFFLLLLNFSARPCLGAA